MNKPAISRSLMGRIRLYQILLLVVMLALWHFLVKLEILPKFFFGEPGKVFATMFE